MNSDSANKTPHLEKKIDLRRKGIFFFFAAFVFVLQGIFFLNDTTTWILLFAIEFFYFFAFPEKKTQEKNQDSWIRKTFRFFIQIALLFIYGLVVVLGWVWLWKATGTPVAFLAAFTAALTGLVFVIWSFAPVFKD
jgi:4-hydroxybenzoate polyprenyltransferase